ncbi:uncharacterized protein KRP23_7394 [Phytophthora ramorum]|uniref:uncharacterized protein n=1 Tax=Phytophthora ramorum TaxID=164328 RepID=UPI0030B77FE7|nr:hypothetical protein KRP23_7394 [Phytophthora ramorum]
MRIPAVKAPAKQHHYGTGNADLDDMAYDCPPILPHQRNRLGHDYYKRQEQKKIWQENQALIKRLQSTKATLNSKEWKKDSKWTQEFLKTQEKRRSALQQELRRAQVSPHAINSPSVVEQKRAELNDGDDEEEAYEEDNFDDDPASPDMGEYGKPPEQTEVKGEASGYGSEFEDEAAVLAIPLTELPPDNQDEGEHDEEDASYSNDDFVE